MFVTFWLQILACREEWFTGRLCLPLPISVPMRWHRPVRWHRQCRTSKARYKKNDSTNNGRQSWFDSDERPFYFSEIKKDFCDSLFHSNDSLFQKNKTAFQKIESWFHFSKAKSSKKQTALSLIRSKNSTNQYQRKENIF